MSFSREDLKKVIDSLSKDEKILLDNILEITHIFEKLKFLYGINFEYKIKNDELLKMKNSYENIKNNSINDYKKIIRKLGYSDNRINNLLEAIDFIKSKKKEGLK
jgi:hypothetical protein